MKLRTLIAATSMAASLPLCAAQVGTLTTFTAGTPARAAEVNGNFAAVQSAVDDNDTRLQQVETNKQDRITGTCAPGSAVTAVAADGTVTCGRAQAGGAVSVSQYAFSSNHEGNFYTARCGYQGEPVVGGWFSGSGQYCTAQAPLSIPDGVTITGFSCLVYDNSGAGATTASILRIELMRSDLTGVWGDEIVAATGATTDSPSKQILSALAPTASRATVDNDAHAYFIIAYFDSGDAIDFDTVSWNVALHGCKVTYTP